MQLNIESPHIRLSEKMTNLVRRKFEHISRLYDRVHHCTVVLRKEKSDIREDFWISATMELPRSVIFGEDKAATFGVALEKVVHNLEHQLLRHKDKLGEKRTRGSL